MIQNTEPGGYLLSNDRTDTWDRIAVYNSIDEPPNSDINMGGAVKVIFGLDSFHKPATWNNHGPDDIGDYAGTGDGAALPEAACDY